MLSDVRLEVYAKLLLVITQEAIDENVVSAPHAFHLSTCPLQ